MNTLIKYLLHYAMKKLNVITGFFFGLLSLGWLLTHHWLAAAACGTLALGFGLSDLAYAPLPNYGTAPALSTWRRYSSILLIGAALVLFGYQISQDLLTVVKGQQPTSSQ